MVMAIVRKQDGRVISLAEGKSAVFWGEYLNIERKC